MSKVRKAATAKTNVQLPTLHPHAASIDVAITAMAHKLARILWHLLKYREAYDSKIWAAAEKKLREKKLKRLHQNAAAFGYKLVTAS
jgi:hypothetical protein